LGSLLEKYALDFLLLFLGV